VAILTVSRERNSIVGAVTGDKCLSPIGWILFPGGVDKFLLGDFQLHDSDKG
jgi:hypothetical protein